MLLLRKISTEGMDRGVLTYAAAFIAGAASALLFTCSQTIMAALTLLFGILTFLLKKHPITFIVCSHLAFITAGAGICTTEKHSCPSRQLPAITQLNATAEKMQEAATNHLKRIAHTQQTHATLCAIAVGEKSFMGKELKKSYSAAGAMHVLALSGLHIGIAFAIIYTLLLPLAAIPYGGIARNIIAIIVIVGYSIFSGCSPSVIRAATMIILYRIAAGKFRHITNWDAIAISAMAILTFSPLQLKNIGFQLSYCAVMGIAMLFPTCNLAFKQMVPQWKGYKKFLWKGIYWLWCSIAISVCCQIATLPASLYHFGYSAPYFLLANLVAVPLATGILYTLTLTLCLQWIPFVGEWCIELLNMLISLLNSAVMYISG